MTVNPIKAPFCFVVLKFEYEKKFDINVSKENMSQEDSGAKPEKAKANVLYGSTEKNTGNNAEGL